MGKAAYGEYPSQYKNLTPEKRAERKAYSKRYYEANREKQIAYTKAYFLANPERRKEQNAKHNPLWRARDEANKVALAGRPRPEICEFCKRPGIGKRKRKTVWDHNHKTGMFRAWLCHQCNVSAGMMDDNPTLIHGLADLIARDGYGPGPAESVLPTAQDDAEVAAYIESCIGVRTV